MMERIIIAIIKYLMRKEWFFFAANEALRRGGMHIHTNPKKRVTLVVDFPEPMEEGIFYPTKEASDG